MKMKMTFIITLFLLCLLMIGAVSAANNDTAVSSDANEDTITVYKITLVKQVLF